MNRWIKIDRVLAIHRRQIAEHGGGDGVRDLVLLKEWLPSFPRRGGDASSTGWWDERPQNIAAYDPGADIARLAGAYAFGIVKNHPFIDGNKRTGYVVMETFLIKNGWELHATPAEKYTTFLRLAEGTLTEGELAAWLRDHLAQSSDS